MGLLSRLRGSRPSASPAEAARRKAEVERAHGPWTAHNARLAEGVWTLRDGVVNFDEKMRRCLQVALDFFGAELAGLRVLDLGAGEGGLALELAAHGARVTCVEGREANLSKARLVAEALGLPIDFVCGDVRAFDAAAASFDLILCFGLFYHLDAPSACEVMARIGRLAKRLLILDTHWCLTGEEEIELGGHRYQGRSFREHRPGARPEEKALHLWASLDNERSFWFTKPSLLNLINRVGFRTVYEVASPLVYDYWDRATEARFRYRDRSTFVAVKSVVAQIRTSPRVNDLPPRPLPEDLNEIVVPSPIDREPQGGG